MLLSALSVITHTCLFWSETHIRLMCSISLQAIFVYTFSTANLSKNKNISSDYYLPFGVIGVNFSLSSCVGDTLLLLLLLCGDDKADTAFPCESIVRTDEFSVVAVARGAPQKFKSNLLPVKRTSRSRRASRSLSKCNCKEKEKNKKKSIKTRANWISHTKSINSFEKTCVVLFISLYWEIAHCF